MFSDETCWISHVFMHVMHVLTCYMHVLDTLFTCFSQYTVISTCLSVLNFSYSIHIASQLLLYHGFLAMIHFIISHVWVVISPLS